MKMNLNKDYRHSTMIDMESKESRNGVASLRLKDMAGVKTCSNGWSYSYADYRKGYLSLYEVEKSYTLVKLIDLGSYVTQSV